MSLMMFKQQGDFKKLSSFLERMKKPLKKTTLDKYGKEGVQALMAATPVDTGLTASLWHYDINMSKDSSSISFYNDNIDNGVPIAIILNYGHGTRNGGYVKGRNYINPAIQPIFDKLAQEAWKEVIR